MIRLGTPALAWLLVAVLPSAAAAKQGFYLGWGLAMNQIGGDFDGESGFVGADGAATEVIILPEIDPGLGLDLSAGFGFTDQVALEGRLIASQHDAEFAGASGDVNYRLINFNLKFSFNPTADFQPFVLAGVGAASVEVEEGASRVDGSGGVDVGDATYSGLSFNFGAGADYYVTRSFSVGGALMFRIERYDQAEGVKVDGDLPEDVNGNGLSLLIGAAYHFNVPH